MRNAWVPGVGVYGISNSEDPSNPTQGTITIRPAKSKAEMDAEAAARKAHFDRMRSGAALKFDIPDKPGKPDPDADNELEKAQEKETEMYSTMVPELEAFLRPAALCNLATVRLNESEGKWQTTGDPTEVALQVFAHRFDKGKKTLEKQDGWTQIYEYPFDSTVKRMSVVYKSPSGKQTMIFIKGAVERILDLCVDLGIEGAKKEMTDEVKESVYEQMTLLADQGLRVLALASKTWEGDWQEDTPRDKVESGLTLLGLAGLYDPPRLETKDAVKGTLYFPNTLHFRVLNLI